jgi:hypothetical protein
MVRPVLVFSLAKAPRAATMSRNYYSEINLHVVWHTKHSAPLLTPKVEQLAHRFLRQRIVEAAGAFVHAIGGVEDHVHLAVTIAPTVFDAVSKPPSEGGQSPICSADWRKTGTVPGGFETASSLGGSR